MQYVQNTHCGDARYSSFRKVISKAVAAKLADAPLHVNSANKTRSIAILLV